LRSLLNSPCLIAAEQYEYCSRGKIEFWSHLREERPENPEIFKGILPVVASIQSKAQAKDFQKLQLKHAQGFFLKLLFHVEFVFRNMPIYGEIHHRPDFKFC